MKILVVSHSYAAAENQKNMAALGAHADVLVAVPSHIDDRVLGRLQAPRGEGARYLISRRISLPRNQFLLADTDIGLKTFTPDIVHIEYDPWVPIFWQTVRAARRYAPRAKIVATVKKNTYRPLPQPLKALKDGTAKRMLARVAHLCAINQGVARIYRDRLGVAPEKITIMQHLGIDPALFFPRDSAAGGAEQKPLIVGFCGRVDPHKGIDELIAAITALNKRTPGSLRLKILGRGALLDGLKAQSLPWLDFASPVPHHEVPQFLHSLDVFVMPARITPDHEEHDGHALMEAMACGIPSIGSTSGIIPELLDKGCGMVFPASDGHALTAALSQLSANADLRHSLAATALKRARDEFSVEGIAQRKLQLYEKVLA